MFKKFAALMLCAWAFSCGPSNAQADMYSDMVSTVVSVEAQEGGGTGVVIGENTILTATHVTKGSPTVNITFSNSDLSFTVTKRNVIDIPNTDITIVHVTVPNTIKVTPILCTLPQMGDRIYSVGFPLGIGPLYSEGWIANPIPEDNLIYSFIPLNHGNSGGPIFNKDMQLIGIVHGGVSDGRKEGAMISLFSAIAPVCNVIKKELSNNA